MSISKSSSPVRSRTELLLPLLCAVMVMLGLLKFVQLEQVRARPGYGASAIVTSERLLYGRTVAYAVLAGSFATKCGLGPSKCGLGS